MKKTIGNYEYSEHDELGRGSFSRVYLGSPIDGGGGEKVAIKVMELPKTDGKTKHLLREIELMRHLKHRNIVRLIDVKYEKFGHMGVRIFIVMEHCAKGDMSSLPRPMCEEDCRMYFRGIFSGLRYLKKRQIIHRDIKPQNILLTADNVVKIADFTFSKQIEENELMQTQCGTPLFISPDVMFGQPYTDKSDLYSCGVMLYSFLYGTHPLGNVKSQADLIQKMKRPKITFPQKLVHESYEPPTSTMEGGDAPILCRTIRVFSPQVLHLCKGLLKFNPADRVSWESIYQDPWLQLDPMEPDELFPPDQAGPSSDHQGPVHAFSAPSQLAGERIIPVPRSSTGVVVKQKRKSTATTAPSAGFGREPSFEQFQFESGENSRGGGARIINDYYSTSPCEGGGSLFNLATNYVVEQRAEEKRVVEKSVIRNHQEMPTLLSRSIDAIQKVFSL